MLLVLAQSPPSGKRDSLLAIEIGMPLVASDKTDEAIKSVPEPCLEMSSMHEEGMPSDIACLLVS